MYPPQDDVMIQALKAANLDGPFAFIEDPEIGYNLVMRLVSNQSCDDTDGNIMSLGGHSLNCTGKHGYLQLRCTYFTQKAHDLKCHSILLRYASVILSFFDREHFCSRSLNEVCCCGLVVSKLFF